jgi:UDPglucose 6-dehydrogenase
MGEEADLRLNVVEAVERTNEAQKAVLVPRVAAHLGGLAGKTVAVWGLAFKPRTDDMREAPAIVLIERLLAAGAKVQAFDPAAMPVAKKLFGAGVTFAPRSYAALAGADALAVVTEWNEFREPDFAKMRKLMKTPVVFDGRNIYSRELMRAHGFTYFSIGR